MRKERPQARLRAIIHRAETLRVSGVQSPEEFWSWRALTEGTLEDLFTRDSSQVRAFMDFHGKRPGGTARRPPKLNSETEKQYIERLLDQDIRFLQSMVAHLDSGAIKPVNRTLAGVHSLFSEFKEWFFRKG
jgi:hypothetical protein